MFIILGRQVIVGGAKRKEMKQILLCDWEPRKKMSWDSHRNPTLVKGGGDAEYAKEVRLFKARRGEEKGKEEKKVNIDPSFSGGWSDEKGAD